MGTWIDITAADGHGLTAWQAEPAGTPKGGLVIAQEMYGVNSYLPAVADDYAKWFIARLRRLNAHLENHDYLVDNRFTIADIAVGYALFLGVALKLDERYTPQAKDYLARLTERPAFLRANEFGEPLQLG